MSDLVSYLRQRAELFKSPVDKFLVEHGRSFEICEATFNGPRATPKECFKNATLVAMADPGMTYVEGFVTVHGVPIQHAWNVDADGRLIDRTLDNHDRRIEHYFGIPFSTFYVTKALRINRVYGLLDGYYSHKTLRDLIDGKVLNWKKEIATCSLPMNP